MRRATQARRERLTAWRRERVKEPGGNDRISAWLDRELDRLACARRRRRRCRGRSLHDPDDRESQPWRREGRGEAAEGDGPDVSPGVALGFPRCRDDEAGRPEGRLEGRGFAVDSGRPGDDPAPVALDRLLPIQPESDEQWLIRRAVTEVSNDSGLRFLQIQNMFLPEPGAGEAMNAGGALAMVSQLTQLLGGEQPADPRDRLLREVAARGRGGAVRDTAGDEPCSMPCGSRSVFASATARAGRAPARRRRP